MIHSVSIKNFKSIKHLEDFKLGMITILIGANGVGKSNFISFFNFLKQIATKNLQNHISSQSGFDKVLFNNRTINELKGIIEFENNKEKNRYYFKIEPSGTQRAYFSEEKVGYWTGAKWYEHSNISSGLPETSLDDIISESRRLKGYPGIGGYVKDRLKSYEVYHFHDTSDKSPMKAMSKMIDVWRFDKNAANIAPFLKNIQEKHPRNYFKIVKSIKSIAPFFDDFILVEDPFAHGYIQLLWKAKGSDEPMYPFQLSDGTLRMIALTTLLLQPNLPETIIIDEPELGLHPHAISKLSDMIQVAAQNGCQVIVSTQSVTLMNHFSYEDIVTVDRVDDSSVFSRLNESQLEKWTEYYGLGDLWEKNVFGGTP